MKADAAPVKSDSPTRLGDVPGADDARPDGPSQAELIRLNARHGA